MSSTLQSAVPNQISRVGRTLVRNVAANFAGQAASVLLVFFSVPYIAHSLGTARYGCLVLLMTYAGALNILNLGINATLVKFVGELLPKEKLADLREYVGTSLTLFLAGGLAVGICASVFGPWIVRHLLLAPADLQHSVVISMWLASGSFVIRSVNQAISAIPLGAQRFDLTNSINASTETLRTVGSIGILSYSNSLEAIMAVTVLSDLLSSVAYILVARRILPEIPLNPRLSLPHLRKLLNFSKYVLVCNISSRVVNSADNFLVSYFLPVANVAFYGVPYSIGQKLWTLVGNVASVVFPAASSFCGRGGSAQVRELYLRAVRATTAVACFPALAFCIFSRPFLLLWMGRDFAAESTLAFRLLSIAFLINSFGFVPYLVLQATDFAHVTARFAGLYAVVNVVMFAILIPRFGIDGAAAGFLISQIVIVPWQSSVAHRLLGIGGKLFLQSSMKPLLALVLACAVCIAGLPVIHSLLQMMLVCGTGLLVYVVTGWFTTLDDVERNTCIGLLRRSPDFRLQTKPELVP
jgi:O-antigen/teichoic acid export membrane protein